PSAVLRMRASDAPATWPLTRASRPAIKATAAPESNRPDWPRKALRACCVLGSCTKLMNDMALLLDRPRASVGYIARSTPSAIDKSSVAVLEEGCGLRVPAVCLYAGQHGGHDAIAAMAGERKHAVDLVAHFLP